MKKLLLPFVLLLPALWPQSADTLHLQGVMLPTNEVPPAAIDARGFGSVRVSVVRNSAGRIVSGSVEFAVSYAFPGDTTFTGLHLHSGPAGANAPVTISSGIGGTDQVRDMTGRGTIVRTAQVREDNATGLATLEQLFRDPSQVYINIHTTTFTGGAVRAQLVRADEQVYLGLMSSRNEVPPIADLDASGVGQARVRVARDSRGNILAAHVTFVVSYRFPGQVEFTGLHIHDGPAGVNGPVRISSNIPRTPSAASGIGNILLTAEVPLTAETIATLEGLIANPGNHYINLHTTANPGGAIRAQLRNTDVMVIPVTMSPANEVPPIPGLNASGPSLVTVNTLRRPDGSIEAGAVNFDVNPRFASAIEFTGLHIHDQTAGNNGPVRISSAIPATPSDGFGNIYLSVNVNDTDGLATLNSLVRNPENHYLNLHTRDNPGGAVRSQLADVDAAVPTVVDVISAVSDPSLKTGGHGGLLTIFGRKLFKIPTGLAGLLSPTAPTSLNGTEVTIGGRAAPIMGMGRDAAGSPPDYIVVQVPFEAATGPQSVVVRNSNGPGAAFTAPVAALAPAIFFDSTGGIAFRVTGTATLAFSLIRPEDPARAGDSIGILSTGLGGTTPALATGQFVPGDQLYNTAAATVLIGGRQAGAITSIAVPGFFGAYLTIFQVPTGLPRGNANVQLRLGESTSNTVTIPIG